MKKFVSLLMTLMLMFGMLSVLGACSKDSAVAEEVPEEEVTAEEEDLSWIEEDPDAVDLNGFYLLRDGRYYSLDGEVQSDDRIGWDTTSGNILYSHPRIYEKSGLGTFFSFGRSIPEPTLLASDKVIAFADSAPTLYLYKVDLYGYGAPVRYYDGKLEFWEPKGDNRYLCEDYYDVSDFEVVDNNKGGTGLVEDYYDLIPGTVYDVSWYAEGELHRGFAGGVPVYTLKPGFDSLPELYFEGYDYEVAGIPTESGYFEYDLSNIEPGTYKLGGTDGGPYSGPHNDTGWKGVIKIK